MVRGLQKNPLMNAKYNPCDEHSPDGCVTTLVDKTLYADALDEIPYIEWSTDQNFIEWFRYAMLWWMSDDGSGWNFFHDKAKLLLVIPLRIGRSFDELSVL